MSSSIRTEIGIEAPESCPVAQASADANTTISHIRMSSGVTPDGMLTEEFGLDTESSVDRSSIQNVFEFDSQRIYRFERDPNRSCVCQSVEQHGCPVSDVHCSEGTLVVSFYAPDLETVREIVTDLRGWCDEIHVQRLTQGDERTNRDFVLVDRERLTARQREVLETSFEMGYFEYPKQANAGEVSDALGISASTFSEHLAAAQGKLLETILQS